MTTITDEELAGLDELLSLNISKEELICLYNSLRNPYTANEDNQTSDDGGALFCNNTWDGIICWPTTSSGTTAVLPCIEQLNGIRYDTSQNATKVCFSNGTWANWTDYGSCVPLPDSDFKVPETGVSISEDTTTIFFTGYTISIVALTLAIWIFTHFKDLRCLRNTIHTHLLITYIMADLVWIVTATLQLYRGETNKGSCIIVIFLHYFHLTNFFWMFVEGFYLYMLVVETFSADKIRLRVYALIGWGVPLPVVIVWAIVKAIWFDYSSSNEGGGHPKLNLTSFLNSCPWMAANSYDWIYMTPAIVVLFVNILFLIKIMWVLITKLRSANSVETQQYRKGSKALLVLFPLLGITYVLVIAGPSEGTIAIYFSHIRAVLLSTQGFLVTLFFCFLNQEVRNTLRHHWIRWRTSRGLAQSSNRRRGADGTNTNNTYRSNSKDGSGRTLSATESTSFQDRSNHKRDISMSEVTTVASFPPSNNTNSAGSNGHHTGALVAAARLANGSSSTTTVAVGRFGGDSSAHLLVKENQV